MPCYSRPCPTFPGRVLAWLCSFNIWYQIFATVYLGFLSEFSPIVNAVILVFFNIIWLITIVSLLSAAFTDPVPVNSSYNMPTEFAKVPPQEQTKAFFKRLSYYAASQPKIQFQLTNHSSHEFMYPRHCIPCKLFKPPRTHHCQTCMRCIPRMDHHCPVIAICVHSHNHKFFLNFLFWATVLCVYSATLITRTLTKVTNLEATYVLNLEHFDFVLWLIAASGWTNAVICAIALIGFQIYLWCMLVVNKTTLESNDCNRKPDYNLGSWTKNINSVLGYNKLLWFIPIQTTPGNGITHPVSDVYNDENNSDDMCECEEDNESLCVDNSDNECILGV